MNIEKLNELAKWLDQGAPHIVFNMNHGQIRLDDLGAPDNLDGDYDLSIKIAKSKGLGDCGTVCCIAGYAAFLENKIHFDWPGTRNTALRIFDLPRNGEYMGHDLFDQDLAPEDCTPEQAAVAVRRVIAGKEPWNV